MNSVMDEIWISLTCPAGYLSLKNKTKQLQNTKLGILSASFIWVRREQNRFPIVKLLKKSVEEAPGNASSQFWWVFYDFFSPEHFNALHWNEELTKLLPVIINRHLWVVVTVGSFISSDRKSFCRWCSLHLWMLLSAVLEGPSPTYEMVSKQLIFWE